MTPRTPVSAGTASPSAASSHWFMFNKSEKTVSMQLSRTSTAPLMTSTSTYAPLHN